MKARGKIMKAVCMAVLVVLFCAGLSGTSRAGSIVAWGLNWDGQCDVPDGNDFVAIADGNDFSLALKSDGSLAAWGINYNGECNVPSGNDFVGIGCGSWHSLALKSDGSLAAWGWNYFGQCDVPAGNDFVAIDGGGGHSLALKSDGSLAAWGNNDEGQCDVPDGNGFVAIAGGQSHSLALKSDGSLAAWGGNWFGECNVPAGNDFVAVDGGYGHSLALKSDGSLVGWGEPYMDLGDPPSGNDFVAISCGRWHCVALKSDGSLAAWGSNYNGECDVPDGNDFVAIAAGGCHNLAIKEISTLLIVEDFESYQNNFELHDVWNDYWVNGSNAEIFLEQDPNIVQDSNKAVMLLYDNSYTMGGKYIGSWMDANPADLEVGPDWTVSGVNTLVVHFRGSAGNSATINDKMWLELADTSSNVGVALYDGDANDVTEEWWHEWDISLWLFDACGVNLTAVEWLAIGFGGYERTGQVEAGGDGVVHFDDIRLEYAVTEVSGDINVVNPSFELDANGVQLTCGSDMENVLGWDSEGGYAGTSCDACTPEACEYCWDHDAVTFWPDGYMIAYMQADYGAHIFQYLDSTDADAVVTAGRRYTLSWYGLAWWNQALDVTLFYGYNHDANVLAAMTQDMEQGEETPWDWFYGELEFVAESGQTYLGETLGIKFTGNTPSPDRDYSFVDDVHLTWEWATEAYDPSPEDWAEFVSKNAALSWTPCVWAAQHEVYFGTDEAAVANADSTDTTGIYKGAQEPNSYTPSGPLVLGETYYWRVDEVNEAYSGTNPPAPPNGRWKGDVWSFRVEGRAYDPSPADGAVGVPCSGVELSWTAGAEAETHDVYFGTDETAVANATTSSPEYETTLSVGTENYSVAASVTVGCTYYWRIDERSSGGSHIVTGDVWSFTVSELLVVEDFESYQNNFELRDVWNDYWVNGSGAEIFLQNDPNFVRDSRSVELLYYNDWKPGLEYPGSWTDANPLDLEVGPDWTVGGADRLVVYFLGRAGNSATINERMWVELADTSSNVGLVLYDGDANDVTEEWWHEWDIDLGLFDACGVDLTAVEWLAIGFGGYERTGQVEAGGTGIVHFDDIQLEQAGAGIEVNVDIKPKFCPNYLSLSGRGTLPVAILGTEGFDVNEVDVASVLLNGVAAVGHSYEDVATPVADGNECDCTVEGADGYLDLALTFETEDIADTFPDVNGGDVLSLALEGALTDGTAIEGSDCVVIRGKR